MRTQKRTHTHRHCKVIHHGPAHSYSIENILLTVELHTNRSHFVLGGRTLTCIPAPSPLILTLFSEREKGSQWHGARVQLSAVGNIYRLRWGLRLNFGSHATDSAKTDIGGRSETDLLHRGRKEQHVGTRILMTHSLRERHREMNFM